MSGDLLMIYGRVESKVGKWLLKSGPHLKYLWPVYDVLTFKFNKLFRPTKTKLYTGMTGDLKEKLNKQNVK